MKLENGRATVFGGVNRISADYQIHDGKVAFEKIISTKMAGDPASMKLENNFTKALASVDAFLVTGHELTLSSKGRVIAKLHSN